MVARFFADFRKGGKNLLLFLGGSLLHFSEEDRTSSSMDVLGTSTGEYAERRKGRRELEIPALPTESEMGTNESTVQGGDVKKPGFVVWNTTKPAMREGPD